MNTDKLVSMLKKNLVPAFGCTDPATPALAAAIAYEKAGRGTVQEVKLVVSNDVFKGAYSVMVPGTNKKGIPFAVALGITCGKPDRGLMVLEECNDDSIVKADCILENLDISVTPDSSKGKIYVELLMRTSNGTAKVIFNGRHDRYSYLEGNGKTEEIVDSVVDKDGSASGYEIPSSMEELCKLVDSLSESDLAFIQEGIDMNQNASHVGLTSCLEESIAQNLMKAFPEELSSGYFSNKIVSSAAGDARMCGCAIPVMSVFGSGNQGALIFCSLKHLGESQKVEPIKILRAITLASLIAGIFNRELEEGTPFCHCALVASTAASAGMVYLMDGDCFQMENAVQMTISSMAGLLCDGAKPNCAQKISLGVGNALENAFISLHSMKPVAADGVLGKTYLDSCKNIYKLGMAIRVTMEKSIVSILEKK